MKASLLYNNALNRCRPFVGGNDFSKKFHSSCNERPILLCILLEAPIPKNLRDKGAGERGDNYGRQAMEGR